MLYSYTTRSNVSMCYYSASYSVYYAIYYDNYLLYTCYCMQAASFQREW